MRLEIEAVSGETALMELSRLREKAAASGRRSLLIGDQEDLDRLVGEPGPSDSDWALASGAEGSSTPNP